MNTLPRTITALAFADPDQFHNFRRHWSKLMRSSRKHELTAAHHLLYLTLLGKDWRQGFTCITNRRKLENGAFQGWVLFRAIGALHRPSYEDDLLAPFDGLVTPLMLQHIRGLVPVQQFYGYRPEQFTTGFPFDAYSVPTQATDSSGRHA